MLCLSVPERQRYGEHREESLGKGDEVRCVSGCLNDNGMVAATERSHWAKAVRCVVSLGALEVKGMASA